MEVLPVPPCDVPTDVVQSSELNGVLVPELKSGEIGFLSLQ